MRAHKRLHSPSPKAKSEATQQYSQLMFTTKEKADLILFADDDAKEDEDLVKEEEETLEGEEALDEEEEEKTEDTDGAM